MNLEYFFIGIILILIICIAFLLGMLAEAKVEAKIEAEIEAKMSEADLQEIKPKTKSKGVDSVEK